MTSPANNSLPPRQLEAATPTLVLCRTAKVLKQTRKTLLLSCAFANNEIVWRSNGLKPISQLRFDYDTTTIRIRRYHDAFGYEEVIEITICVRFDCDTTTTRLRRKIDMFIFARVESRRMEAGARYVLVGS